MLPATEEQNGGKNSDYHKIIYHVEIGTRKYLKLHYTHYCVRFALHSDKKSTTTTFLVINYLPADVNDIN